MSLIHGKAVSAEELERILSREFDARRFASFCNAVAWCSARQRCSTLPAFTERVNVKDKGIDASWNVTLLDDQEFASGLLGPGWNVFQYKQRDIFAQGRSATYSNIKSDMQRALKKLYEETQKRPVRYVLFTNLDLIPAQNEELRKAILSEYDQKDQVIVSVVGAAELAAFLVDLPHVRSQYFETASCSTWEAARRRHEDEELFSNATIELVGRDMQLAELRSLIDDPSIKAIIVAGPQGIGKTRLVLEATHHRTNEVVVVDGSIALSDIQKLRTPETEVVVIVDDPEKTVAEALVQKALSASGIKILITLPTAADVPTPNFGRDKRVQVLSLAPLTDSEAYDLLNKANAGFYYSIESWVISQAGGIPRILLLAAGLGPELHKTARTFIEDVAEAYERKVRARFGDTVVATLKRLSLLTQVRVRSSVQSEIRLICQEMGEGPNASAVLNALPELSKAGLIRVGGSYVEVLPPLLANRLAAKTLRGRFIELLTLFARLKAKGRSRLVARLAQLRSDEAKQFWNELLGEHGLFPDIHAALANIHLFRQVSVAVPEWIATFVHNGLQGLSPEERLAIRHTERRELMWVLEELLFRSKTSLTALRSLVLLAEAENETFSNSASGVFCETFHALHHQVPLALSHRLKVLRENLSSQNSTDTRLLALKAAEAGMQYAGGYTLRQTQGPEPLDVGPEMTNAEFWGYTEALVDTILQQAHSDDAAVSSAARQAVPRALIACASQIPPEHCLPRFDQAVDWTITKQVAIPVAELVDALHKAQQIWREYMAQSDPDGALQYQACIEHLRTLTGRFEQTDFSLQLKRWAGDWIYDDELEGDSLLATQDRLLESMGQEVAQDASLLPADLLVWVCSLEAKRGTSFLFSLGKHDTQKFWWPQMERLAADPLAAIAFSAYCDGLGRHDPAFVNTHLEVSVEQHTISDDAIVQATRCLGGSLLGVKRMERMLREGRADPFFIARTLMVNGWMTAINSRECTRLLEAMAGPTREHGAAAVDFLGMWMHFKRPIKGRLAELAWDCLEYAEVNHHNEEYAFDRLAAYLTKADKERGFHLLERLLSRPYARDCWTPFSHGIQNTFWEALRKHDQQRAIRTLLTLLQQNRTMRYRLSYRIQGALKLDQDKEILVEYASENEENAKTVADSISSKHPGFWPVVFAIIAHYPDNEAVSQRWEHTIWESGGYIMGRWSSHLQRCQDEATRIINDPATPSAVRGWLREVKERFAVEAEQYLNSEADEEVDELRQGNEDVEDAEQIWAARTLAYHTDPL